mmetsp:Transcript_25663/g.28491  ORF Transcript_25663/g.28491 Transcript_25663/m.28491 type:complete len:255 (+) Transcript_25663:101-865(+)
MVEEQEALDSIMKGFGSGKQFTDTCLQILINKNFFSPLEYLIHNVYHEENENDIIPILRRFFSKVREQQDLILSIANGKKELITVGPAFQWAQDMDTIALQVKFAHRLDSPSCIDIYDQNVTITESNITVYSMCKKHDGVIKFSMNHELYELIDPLKSSYEFQSGGRLYINMTKQETNKRWRRLLRSDQSPNNMRVWYEQLERIGDLEENTIFETDDAFEDLVHIERPRNGRKKKNKKKKNKKRKASKIPKEDL